MERMSWVMELFDKISGPANTIAKSMAGANQALQGASGGALTAGQSFSLLGAGIAGWMSIGSKAVDVAVQLGHAFVEGATELFKFSFEMFSFKESTLATMAVLYGTKDAAAEMFQTAIDYARKTPFQVDQVTEAFTRLRAAGFKKEEVPVVFQGVADIAALSGRGAQGMQSLMLAMSEIMSMGSLGGRQLRMLEIDTNGIISNEKMVSKLAQIMGVSTEEAGSMMHNGLVPAKTAIMAIMQVSKDLGGGVIGQASVNQSLTLAGIWSNLAGMAKEMFLTMDFGKLPGIQVLKDTMNNLITLFSTNTESGARFQKVLMGIVNGGMMKLAEFATPEGLTKMVKLLETAGTVLTTTWDLGVAAFTGLYDGFKPFLEAMAMMSGDMGEGSTAAAGMYEMMKGLGNVVGALGVGFMVVYEVIAFAVAGISAVLYGLWDIFVGIADFVVGGLVEGLTNGWDAAVQQMELGVESMIAGAKRILGIASPSKVFEEMGQYTVEGYEKGLEGMPDPSLAIEGGPRGGGVGGAGGMTLHLEIHVDNHGGDGDQVASRIAETLPSALAQLLDRMSREGGLLTQ